MMLKKSPSRSIAIALLAGLGATLPAYADMASPKTPFVAAVMKNFDTWDTNHDGTLSADEMDHAVRNPAVKGDDAAAAASIKLISRNKKITLPPLTKEYFMKVDAMSAGKPRLDAASAEKATQDVLPTDATAPKRAEAQPEWAKYFAASRGRIAKGGPGAVWQPSTMSLEHMSQGPLGDCFFIASVGSIVTHRPELLDSLVMPMGDGSFKVTFPNAKPIVVPAITDAERAISSTTADDGAWMAVMEQGYGKYRSTLKGGPEDIDGTEILRKGGDSSITIMQLTGHRTHRISFGKTLQIREADEAKVLPEVRKALTENITDHRLITAGVDPPTQASYEKSMKDAAAKSGKPLGELGTVPNPPAGVQKSHVYTIVAFDPKTDLITIWNPHGQTWNPKGTPGLVNGYPTRHGLFTLPLKDAYRFYTSFTFETDQPVEKTTVSSAVN